MATYHDVICQKMHNQRVIHHQWALCTSPTRHIYIYIWVIQQIIQQKTGWLHN